MPSLNRVLLIGNLTRDPEVKFLPSGDPVAEFGLAVNRRFKTKQGEDRDEVCFIRVSMFGRRAEVIGRYFKKGSPIFVEGRLKFDEWEKDGRKQNRITMVAENFEFMDSPRGGDRSSQPPVDPQSPVDPVPEPESDGNAGRPPKAPDEKDDDNLPF